MKHYIIALFLFSLLTINLFAKKTPPQVRAYKVIGEINLDGKLNEPVWKNPPVDHFTQLKPDEGKPATEKTDVWVAYDENYIYVAAKLYDSNPDSIDQSLFRKDNMNNSDFFGLGLDPYHDKRTGFFFGVNPAGSLTDGVIFNDTGMDDSWDGIWEAKTKTEKDGWSVEIRIPFSQLRFNEAKNMVWGINFIRSIKRKNEEDFYVLVPQNESGFASRFAELRGLSGVKPKRRVEAFPYLVQKAQFLIHDNNDPFYKGNQFRTSVGADFKIGIGTNLNLDLTVNPDFGQVEVDPAVVNLSAFETFFQEKRQFFIEGQSIFRFGSGGSNNNWNFSFSNPRLFYSRRIGRRPQGNVPGYDFIDYPKETRILGAAKLTGKLKGDWSVGAISAVTQRMFANYFLDNVKHNFQVEPLTHYGVFRTQKEFQKGKQGIGLIFTSVNRDLNTPELRDMLNSQAYTFGIDGWTFFNNDDYVLSASVAGSFVKGSKQRMISLQEEPYRYFQRPDATYERLDSNRTSLAGWYSRVSLNKQNGNFYFNVALGASSPKFEFNDMGFQRIADKINGHLVLGYRWFQPDGIFRRKFLYLAHFRNFDFEGNAIANGIFSFGRLEFMNYYSIGYQTSYNFRTLSKTLTRGGPLSENPRAFWFGTNISSDSREDIVLGLNGNLSRDELGGNSHSVGLEIRWRPWSQVNLSIGPEYSSRLEKVQYINTLDDKLAVSTFGKRYIFAELNQETVSANIRVNWTFTPTLSLQLFLQPLISVGDYSNFKELAEPRTLRFNKFGENGSTINYNNNSDEYTVDPDGNGPAQNFDLSNPDFNFKSLRGTIVLRWEVLPGSIFYLVWSQDRTNFNDPGSFSFGRDFSNLWQANSDNIFLAKFTYWLNM